MRLKTTVGIILAFALLLQGCGRKGPLTLPDARQAASLTTTQGR